MTSAVLTCRTAEAALNTSLADQGGRALMTSAPSPRPGILLDRDGMIIVDHGYVGSVDCVEFIEEAHIDLFKPGYDTKAGY